MEIDGKFKIESHTHRGHIFEFRLNKINKEETLVVFNVDNEREFSTSNINLINATKGLLKRNLKEGELNE